MTMPAGKKTYASGAIRAAGKTDRGMHRIRNEDSLYLSVTDGLFIVSDGLGGHSGGDVASKIVVEVLPGKVQRELNKMWEMGAAHAADAVCRALIGTNDHVHKEANSTDGLHDMGATVIACLIIDRLAVLAHMGDSRAYLLRAGVFEQLTKDHTVTELLVQMGHITRKEAKKHFGRNTLTFYAGMSGEAEPEVNILHLEEGDRLLLCSDGLTDELTAREIAEILFQDQELECICKSLVDAANGSGGRDNITAIIIQNGAYAKKLPKGKDKMVIRQSIGRSLKRDKATAE